MRSYAIYRKAKALKLRLLSLFFPMRPKGNIGLQDWRRRSAPLRVQEEGGYVTLTEASGILCMNVPGEVKQRVDSSLDEEWKTICVQPGTPSWTTPSVCGWSMTRWAGG